MIDNQEMNYTDDVCLLGLQKTDTYTKQIHRLFPIEAGLQYWTKTIYGTSRNLDSRSIFTIFINEQHQKQPKTCNRQNNLRKEEKFETYKSWFPLFLIIEVSLLKWDKNKLWNFGFQCKKNSWYWKGLKRCNVLLDGI
jgi:hypothetical protein